MNPSSPIPDSITTTGTLRNDQQAHLMTRIDDLTSRVLAISDLQASVTNINQRLDQTDLNTANVMQGIQSILSKLNATTTTKATSTLSAVCEDATSNNNSSTQSNSTSFTPPIDLLDLTTPVPVQHTNNTASTNAPTSNSPSTNALATTAVTSTAPLNPLTTAVPSTAPTTTTVPPIQAPTPPPSQPVPSPLVPPTPPFSNATHQSFTPTPVQHPPPNMINQATIPFLFQQQQPTAQSSTGQTVIVQQTSNQQRKFDKFKPQKGDTYTYWKTSSFSQLHTDMDPFYNTMITFDPTTTGLNLNTSMSPQQNSRLYFMTTKALGQLAQKFISQADQHRSNGQELWKALDGRYLNKEQSSILLQEGLTAAYDALRMQPNESMFDFAHRYDVAYGKLVHNNMDVCTGAALTLHFIKAINKPTVFASLKTKLQLPLHSQYITDNIKQL
jgi:hypothetical protein